MGLHVAHRMDTDMLEEGLVWRVPRGSDRGGQDVAAEQEDSNCGKRCIFGPHPPERTDTTEILGSRINGIFESYKRVDAVRQAPGMEGAE